MASSGSKTDEFSATLLGGSETDIELYCVPCDRQGPRIAAFGYCQDCLEHLCETCYQVHTKPTPSRNHVLLDGSAMPRSMPSLQDVIPSVCSKHDRSIEYNCKRHYSLCCNVCVTMDHRLCKVDYIPDISKEYEASEEFKRIKGSLNDLMANIKETKQGNDSHRDKIEENRNKVKQDIRQYRKSFDKILDQWEENMFRDLEPIFDELAAQNYLVDKVCDKLLADLRYFEGMLQSFRGQNEMLYIGTKACGRKMEECRHKFKSVDTYYFHPRLFEFQPNTQLQPPLQTDVFGRICKRKRADEILVTKKQIKEIEEQLNDSFERAKREGLGITLVRALFPWSDINPQMRHMLKAKLELLKRTQNQLEEAERNDSGQNN